MSLIDREAVELVFAAFPPDACFVCANGYISREAFNAADAERNFYGVDNVLGRVQKFVPREGAGFMELMGRPDPALQ